MIEHFIPDYRIRDNLVIDSEFLTKANAQQFECKKCQWCAVFQTAAHATSIYCMTTNLAPGKQIILNA